MRLTEICGHLLNLRTTREVHFHSQIAQIFAERKESNASHEVQPIYRRSDLSRFGRAIRCRTSDCGSPGAKIAAVKDAVDSTPPHDIGALTKALEAIMTGVSAGPMSYTSEENDTMDCNLDVVG